MLFTKKMLKKIAVLISKTEYQKCENAINIVRDALREAGFADVNMILRKLEEETDAYMVEMYNSVSDRNVKIFVYGSYANKTNVKVENAIDIAVVLESVLCENYQTGVILKSNDFIESSDNIKIFKNDVEQALKDKFGMCVERGNKAILVKGNEYRVDINVVPCLRYKEYPSDDRFDVNNYIGGILIQPDKGDVIINYPERHIRNGHIKNINTNLHYRKAVRIIKKIRYIMQENNYMSAAKVSSFGLESLLWNVPDSVYLRCMFNGYMFQDVIEYLYNYNSFQLSHYREANGYKKLCPNDVDIVNYTNFINDICSFYKYK